MRANRRVSVKTVIEVVWQIKNSMSQIIDKLKAGGKIRQLASEKSGTWKVIEYVAKSSHE